MPLLTKPENVTYWSFLDLCKMIESDCERMIVSDINKTKNNKGRKKSYKYGYHSNLVSSEETTVDVVIGGDHGAGAFRLLGKLNYLPAKKNQLLELGSRIFQFGNIKCKKDTAQIIALLSPAVNKALEDLNGGMLVGVRGKNKNDVITCIFLHKSATHLRTAICDGRLFLKWTERGLECEKELKGMIIPDTFNIWTIVQNFTYFITGDLAFYATILGRDGTSASRCPWCDLTAKEWKGDNPREGLPLTYQRLTQYARDLDEWNSSCQPTALPTTITVPPTAADVVPAITSPTTITTNHQPPTTNRP